MRHYLIGIAAGVFVGNLLMYTTMIGLVYGRLSVAKGLVVGSVASTIVMLVYFCYCCFSKSQNDS